LTEKVFTVISELSRQMLFQICDEAEKAIYFPSGETAGDVPLPNCFYAICG
jgi:hypothetical protein